MFAPIHIISEEEVLDTTPPSSPTAFTLSAFGWPSLDVSVSWTAATDNVAVSNYVVQITLTSDTNWNSSSEHTFTNTSGIINIGATGSYKGRVLAVDTSSNESGYSNEDTATVT